MLYNCLRLAGSHDVRYGSTTNSLAHYKFVARQSLSPAAIGPPFHIRFSQKLMYTYTDAAHSIRHGSGPHFDLLITDVDEKTDDLYIFQEMQTKTCVQQLIQGQSALPMVMYDEDGC